jgi:hypothetical protein
MFYRRFLDIEISTSVSTKKKKKRGDSSQVDVQARWSELHICDPPSVQNKFRVAEVYATVTDSWEPWHWNE